MKTTCSEFAICFLEQTFTLNGIILRERQWIIKIQRIHFENVKCKFFINLNIFDIQAFFKFYHFVSPVSTPLRPPKSYGSHNHVASETPKSHTCENDNAFFETWNANKCNKNMSDNRIELRERFSRDNPSNLKYW